MAATLSNEEGPISAINVTPFVDVVLVLLVVLMVTSTEIVRQALSVDLPRSATADDAVPRTLNVTLSASGEIRLDGEPATESTLSKRVAAAQAADPEVRAVISADQAVAYRGVVRVIDLVKAAGVHRFALDVVPEGAP